ncbi:nucleolar protein 12-like [Ptychodera flava]|uniref:nucleolar protein 12-like n=1 Tax=Ptychodera flava TaxID=63121 RepID=UPI00396A91BA
MAASISNQFRQKNPRNRQNKFHLVFDEENRKDFLTGFRKRKDERRKKARQDAEKKLKEERSQIKKEKRKFVREKLQNLDRTSTSYKALDRLLNASEEPVVYDHPEHTVTVTTITDVNLDENVIGPNEVNYSDKGEDSGDDGDQESSKTEIHSNQSRQMKRRKRMQRYMKFKKQSKIAKAKRKRDRTGLKKKRKK